MSQQTELRSLTPGLGHLLRSWWRPWSLLLRTGVRFSPLLFVGAAALIALDSAQQAAEAGPVSDPFAMAMSPMAEMIVFLIPLVGSLAVLSTLLRVMR